MIHLLIADDDITILEGLSRFISVHFPDTFRIYTAENGIQALDIMREIPVHILLSDIKMPMLDGIRLIEILKQGEYGCQTIILSGYDDYPLIRTALKSGACDYLLKPVNFSLLSNALDELLSSMESLPPVSPDGLRGSNFSALFIQSGSSQTEFYDIPVTKNPFITIGTLNDYLEKAQAYMINSDREHTIYTMNQFFSHLHPDLISREEVRDILSQFIYNLMHKNSSMIKIISDDKLTDYDVLSCIKNMPTLSQLQDHFIRIIGRYIEKLQASHEANENYIVKKAVSYINSNYKSELLLEDVAGQLHLHPNYFSRLFRLQTGTTFRDYLRNVRIEKSKELLLHSSYKISQIAQLVGYQDIAHFNRAFKDMTGTSPSRYRKTFSAPAAGPNYPED